MVFRQIRFTLDKYAENLKDSYLILETKGALAKQQFEFEFEDLRLKSISLVNKADKSGKENDKQAFRQHELHIIDRLIDFIWEATKGGVIGGEDLTREHIASFDNELLTDITATIFNGDKKK